MYYVGQQSNIEMIDMWEELPNFLIIQGEEHTGKAYLTLYLCKKFNLRYNKVNNSINSVRNMVNTMGKDTNLLFHFDNFDKASIQAKNALLKVTEEPVKGNYIVITGGPQIKTLESRARKIVMQPYSISEIENFVNKMLIKVTDKQLMDLYMAGINTPAKIQYYINYEKLFDILNYAYLVFNNITLVTPEMLMSITTKFEDRYEPDKIDECMLFLNMLINIIKTNIEQNMYYSYAPMLQILMDTKRALVRENTLKRKMLLFKTFYDIAMINGMGGVTSD